MKERIFESFNVEHSIYEDLTSSAEKQARLLAALYPLSVDEQDAIDSYDKSFMTKFTYNSAAIEGSTLSLPETALVLEGEFEPSKDSRARRFRRGGNQGRLLFRRAFSRSGSMSR